MVMPFLSDIARRKKIEYFLNPIPKSARILEIGCGSGWVGEYLKSHGWENYTGLDIVPPADLVGDITCYQEIGLSPGSFDVIIAFEVVEHVDCFFECHELLSPGGRLLLTSPVPRMDWFLKILEATGLNQKRTSPHDHLIDFSKVEIFPKKEIKVVAGLSQWGIFYREGR